MEGRAEPKGVRLGWTERAYASVPLSPAALGAALAGALVVAFVASEFVLGRHLLLSDHGPRTPLSLAGIAIVNCLTAGYLPTAYVYLLRGCRSTFAQLAGQLDGSDAELAAVGAGIGQYQPVALGLAGLAGSAGLLWVTRLTTPPEIDLLAWSSLPQEVLWHRVLILWNGPWIGIFILSALIEGRRFSRLARRVSRVDLLDLAPVRPFTRQALFTALLVAGLGGIGLLSVVESRFWDVVIGYWILSALAIALGLGFALLPLHRLIRDAKQTQLDWCREALIRERTKLQDGDAERSRMEEILAYHGFVEGVSTWPFDSSSFARVLLYLLIPLGSWAGGAIVERFVDSLLG